MERGMLYGGPSYNYTHGRAREGQDLTEQQYFEEQALQQSLNQQQYQYMGQSNYQAEQSYSQSYLQNFKANTPWTRGHGTIAEEGEEPSNEEQQQQEQQQNQENQFKRNTETAFTSWGIGDTLSSLDSQTRALNISVVGSSVDVLMKRGDKNIKGLHKLAAQGDRSGIMQKIKREGLSAPLNELDVNGCTPLMYAAVADSRTAIEMLLNFSAKREQIDSEGRTAVHYAAFFAKHRALKFLIDTAADWTPRDRYGRTPLHWSCAARGTRCLEVLLSHAQLVLGNLNPQDNEAMTPLHCAALFCRARHILILQEAGCDPTLLDIENKTALHWTATNPDTSCIETLVNLYPALLNQQDIYGMTILHEVARKGAIQLAPGLLGIEGIDIDAKDNLERTALHWACAEGHSEIAVLLLVRGALDSCIDAYGLTALHYSVHLDSLPSLQAFARLQDLKHLPDQEGLTPLMHAAAKVATETVQVLLTNSVVVKDINRVNSDGHSALHFACLSGASQSVKALLSSGADPNLPDVTKLTALHLASQNGHGDCMQNLISGGAEMDVYDGDQQTPLHKATLYLQMEAVQVLAMNGANLNMKDGTGNTALHMAVYSGNNAILEVLLEQMANPNLQDNLGVCSLHLAATEGYTDCVETLLAHKAYVNFIDFSEHRYTPLDYARLRGHADCVKLLSDAGAVVTDDIEGMAALTIQTAYRAFKARQLFSNLQKENQAATLICKHVRGFLQVRRYRRMKARRNAAILIQAHIKGILERIRFRSVVAHARETKAKWKMMEDFSMLVERGKKEGMLRTFVPIYDLSPEEVDTAASLDQFREHERKLRFEASMQMRCLDKTRQDEREAFRKAELQRREDKASAQELTRLRGIIDDCRARRDHTVAKLAHRKIVRSHLQAVVIIQRAYRRLKQRRWAEFDESSRLRRQREAVRARAARTIQKAWRRYWEEKVFRARHFMSVMTEPVLDISKRVGVNPGRLPTYQRGISITGSPKRKIHRTLPSEFKMLRPRTRDLLLLPSRDHTDGGKTPGTSGGLSSHQPTWRRNSPQRARRGITSLILMNPGVASKAGKTDKPVVLPQLLTKSMKETRNQIKTKESLQLPQIN